MKPTVHLSPTMIAAARELRNNPTPAEEFLWRFLRSKRLHGYRFRRQCPLGPYVVDFFCVQAQLAVEVDGPIHDFPEAQTADRQRDMVLAGHGIRVVRVSNEEVLHAIWETLDVIHTALSERTPRPPEQTPRPPEQTPRPPLRGGEHP